MKYFVNQTKIDFWFDKHFQLGQTPKNVLNML